MKFTSLLFLVFLGINFLSAQNLFLLENDSTGETFKIKEGLKVRVKTFGGDKYSGTLKIIDENTITVHGNTVSLDEIEKIKRHPFILTFFYGLQLLATLQLVY